jgi:uncharacterized protein
MLLNIYITMRILITEEQNKKLFIPRKLNADDSRYSEWNNSQPMVDGKRINQYDYEGNKTGIWEEYWSNGELLSKGSYKNDDRNGYWETYYDNGNLYSKGSYKDGKRDGYWEEYYDNGKIWFKGDYKNNELIKKLSITEEQNKKLFIPRKLNADDSRYSEWNNAQPIKDGIRINQYDIEGNKQGYWELYYSNGKLEYKGSYLNGLRDGYFEEYYSNGKIFLKGSYVNGNLNGLFEEYYFSNGKLESKGNYKDGKEDGIWFYYYERGGVEVKANYSNGYLNGERILYNTNGKISDKQYWENDKLIKVPPITESKKLFIPRKLSSSDSRYTEHNNSQPMVDGKRINQYDIEGNKIGYWELFDDGEDSDQKGKKISKGNYVAGKRDGYWETYYSGKIKYRGKPITGIHSKGSYKDGKKHGIWYWYDIHGNIFFKSNYDKK